MTIVKNKIIKGCGVQGCCPTVEFQDKEVVLKDDFGNVARMTKEQWISLAKQTVKGI